MKSKPSFHYRGSVQFEERCSRPNYFASLWVAKGEGTKENRKEGKGPMIIGLETGKWGEETFGFILVVLNIASDRRGKNRGFQCKIRLEKKEFEGTQFCAWCKDLA